MAKIYTLPKQLHPDFILPGIKPHQPVEIDWSNPITEELRFCFAFINGDTHDLVSEGIPSKNGDIEHVSTTGESGYECDASGDYLELAHDPKHDLTGPITLFWRGTINSSRFHYLMGKHAGNGGTNNPFGLRTISNGTRAELTRAGTSQIRTYDSTGTNAITVGGGVINSIGASIVDGDVASDCRWLVNGTFRTATGGTTDTVTSSSAALRMGQRPDGTTVSLDGTMMLAVGWARVFSDAELLSMQEDPFQILRPVAPMMYFKAGVAASSGAVHTLAGGGGLAGPGGIAGPKGGIAN